MPKMIDMIRQSAVPANIMRSAALGALALPAAEVIEILVLLAGHRIFGEQARMTLAGWDEAASLAVASDPATPKEVLDYMMAPQNRRPRLLPALIENPSVPEPKLLELAQTPSREIVNIMLASARVHSSANLLHALATNPHLDEPETQQINNALAVLGEKPADSEILEGLDDHVSHFITEHAAEIAAEEGKAFELVGGTLEDDGAVVEAQAVAPAPAAPPTAAAAAPAPLAKAAKPDERERISTLQKIAKLTVGDRVQLAMKGAKEERFILIRDGSKVVSSAVLESPKLSDVEVETFASMKNVQESVLRGIAGKRKFIRNYGVLRALVNNPRCPMDVALTLLKNLLVSDLRNLSANKNISDTVRKVALKAFQQKSTSGGKGRG